MNLAPSIPWQLFDDNGDPLSGGQLWCYESGTNTPQTTYQDQDGDATNENPIILDAAGRYEMWLDPDLEYDFLLLAADDSTVTSWEGVSGSVASADVVVSVNDETGVVVFDADDIEFVTATTTDWFEGEDVTAAIDSLIEQVDENITDIAAIQGSGTSTQVSYTGNSTLAIGDKGKTHYKTDGSQVTINGAVFAAGDRCYITNANSLSTMTLVQGSGSMQLYCSGVSSAANRTLQEMTRVEVYFLTASAAVITGPGVS
jgi:hypothetical protein